MNKVHIHSQDTPAETWVVLHALDGFPNVDVMIDTGEKILPSTIVIIDANTTEIRFTRPYSGSATCVGRGVFPVYTREGLGGGGIDGGSIDGGSGEGPTIWQAVFSMDEAINFYDREIQFPVVRTGSQADDYVGWQITQGAFALTYNEELWEDVGSGAFVSVGNNFAEPINWDMSRSGTLSSSTPSVTLSSMIASRVRTLDQVWFETHYALNPDEQALLLVFPEPRELPQLVLDVSGASEYDQPGVYRILPDIEGPPGVFTESHETYWLSGQRQLRASEPRDFYHFADALNPPVLVAAIMIVGQWAYPQGFPALVHGVYTEHEIATAGTATFGVRSFIYNVEVRDVGPITAPRNITVELIPPASGAISSLASQMTGTSFPSGPIEVG